MSTSAVHLYRRILRLHRRMPDEVRFLGDRCVRDEFRRHRTLTAESPYLRAFFQEWSMYANEMQAQLSKDGKVKGRGMDMDTLEKMSDQQLGQLWELRSEASKPREP
ncbi:hypothetical protein RI367_004700 [Sorochytrium milnesiophthora]